MENTFLLFVRAKSPTRFLYGEYGYRRVLNRRQLCVIRFTSEYTNRVSQKQKKIVY